jgi:hypothetical protein
VGVILRSNARKESKDFLELNSFQRKGSLLACLEALPQASKERTYYLLQPGLVLKPNMAMQIRSTTLETVPNMAIQLYYQENLSCPMGRQTSFAARAIEHHTRRAMCKGLSASPGTVSSASSQAENWPKNQRTLLCLGPSTYNTWVRSQSLLRSHLASRVPNKIRLLHAERPLMSTTHFRASPPSTSSRTHNSRSASFFSRATPSDVLPTALRSPARNETGQSSRNGTPTKIRPSLPAVHRAGSQTPLLRPAAPWTRRWASPERPGPV